MAQFIRNLVLGFSIENMTPLTHFDRTRIYIQAENNTVKGFDVIRNDDQKIVCIPINENVKGIQSKICILGKQDIESCFYTAHPSTPLSVDQDKDMCIRYHVSGETFSIVNTQFLSKEPK